MRTLWIVLILLFTSFPAVAGKKLIQLHPYQREISLAGFSRPVQTVTVTSEVSARCLQVMVDVGDQVGSSGIIAQLDETFVRLELEKNSVAQQKAARELELEEKTVARYTNLINKQSAAQATYDEAALRADILTLTARELKIEGTRLSELQKRHKLRGPPGWEVIERYIEPGEFIAKGTSVVRLGDFRRLKVPFLLTHQELKLLQKSGTLHLHCPDLGRGISGRIHTIGPGFEEKSRKIPVELLVDGHNLPGENFLRGGMRVVLTLIGKEEKELFVVPVTALVSRYEAHWLVTPEGRWIKVIVLGENGEGAYSTITGSGLKAGDTFVAQPKGSESYTTGVMGR